MRRKGFTLVELLVVIAIIALLMGILMPALARVRQIAFRMVCGTNLSGIGKAMLIYANDYQDELPKAGGKGSTWAGKIPNWLATNRLAAYNVSATGAGGTASITSCFYLLVKYAEVTPKSFICKGDSGASEFKPADDNAGNRELIDLWDFGIEPYRHCSYSYHLPFDKYALTTASEPGMAVAADRNPFQISPFSAAKLMSGFDPPPATRERIKGGNAVQHQDEGQNVLFLDSHVEFEKSPTCGITDDNIWTYWDGGAIQRGSPPIVGSTPPTITGASRRLDSFLVTDGDGQVGSAGTGGTGGTGGKDRTGCFLATAIVWVNGTQTTISNVTAGQSVASQEATALTVSDAEVETVQKRTGTYDCYDVKFLSGNSMTVAEDHYFMLSSGQWTSVRHLTDGSTLKCLNGTATVKSISKRAEAFVGTIYNLKIKGTHQYAVGQDKVIARDY